MESNRKYILLNLWYIFVKLLISFLLNNISLAFDFVSTKPNK